MSSFNSQPKYVEGNNARVREAGHTIYPDMYPQLYLKITQAP